jgi:hypothetical protein
MSDSPPPQANKLDTHEIHDWHVPRPPCCACTNLKKEMIEMKQSLNEMAHAIRQQHKDLLKLLQVQQQSGILDKPTPFFSPSSDQMYTRIRNMAIRQGLDKPGFLAEHPKTGFGMPWVMGVPLSNKSVTKPSTVSGDGDGSGVFASQAGTTKGGE